MAKVGRKPETGNRKAETRGEETANRKPEVGGLRIAGFNLAARRSGSLITFLDSCVPDSIADFCEGGIEKRKKEGREKARKYRV
jgi:hypothetical protein